MNGFCSSKVSLADFKDLPKYLQRFEQRLTFHVCAAVYFAFPVNQLMYQSGSYRHCSLLQVIKVGISHI